MRTCMLGGAGESGEMQLHTSPDEGLIITPARRHGNHERRRTDSLAMGGRHRPGLAGLQAMSASRADASRASNSSRAHSASESAV